MSKVIKIRSMEFHVARRARDRYAFDAALFSLRGNVIFANFHAARVFAQRMNAQRDLARFPEQAVKAAQLNALGLIDEIMHFMIGQYLATVRPGAMGQAVQQLGTRYGAEALDTTLLRFAEEFPPLAVYRAEQSAEEYLTGSSEGIPNREILLEELLLLWLENDNPAMKQFRELFDSAELEKKTSYRDILTGLEQFFEGEPTMGRENASLIALLQRPSRVSPHSLTGQLEYMLGQWAPLLTDSRYLFRILNSLDFVKEEEKPIFLGPGPAQVYDFRGQYPETEQFSMDRDWMPNLVLLAKNTYVWLDQLSRKYSRAITKLDEIPDEELDDMARRGFTGLWLIGLWERSQASQRIKQMMGNSDAVASAYSLYDYACAADLGGDVALEGLRSRAWQRGIRLASDMVPNHVGIDSRWVIEHPDWFVSVKESPFPSYTFDGPNLSSDERVGIYLEDHYYTCQDAAVVFKRVDMWTGDTRYIYHGNDGTSMPWNDTAQLDYLNPEVREAVIQTILHVARNFPIIRFDAAMTLAKKHIQRLWFPEPGNGGAIPSRAEHSMTRDKFDAAIPTEFWRDVVDRVAAEAPDTLLLAEAFWLMEGYFVRTLGMHRVYNSAFMNMMRDEDNAKYRSVIKNTIEFDPEILKRYVNFMNNPDERTAIEQFGDGDKYFGICTMLSTLPGLPMFGHGQVEGFSEKYGMEYRRACWNEEPKEWLIQRHVREIFPLLHRRHIFAEDRNFLLYDCFTPDGSVNEDVFAFSNRAGNESGLVLYHNRYATARGWIRTSAAFTVKHADGSKSLQQRTLAEGLALEPGADNYTIFADAITGQEFIRRNNELHERGLYVELEAYKTHVFLDFRQVTDDEQHRYGYLHDYLNGRGVPSIENALLEVILQSVLQPYQALLNPATIAAFHTARALPDNAELVAELTGKMAALRTAVREFADKETVAVDSAIDDGALFTAALALPDPELDDAATSATLYGWLIVHDLARELTAVEIAGESRSLLDEWQLGRILRSTLLATGLSEDAATRAMTAIELLTEHQRWYAQPLAGQVSGQQLLASMFREEAIQRALQVNRYQEILYFNKEAYQRLLSWMLLTATIKLRAEKAPAEQITRLQTLQTTLRQAAEQAEYQVGTLLDMVVV